MDKFIETYGERPDGHGGLPTMATRAQDTWDALRAAYEIGKSEAPLRFTARELVDGTPIPAVLLTVELGWFLERKMREQREKVAKRRRGGYRL